jgi:hypothetical protein
VFGAVRDRILLFPGLNAARSLQEWKRLTAMRTTTIHVHTCSSLVGIKQGLPEERNRTWADYPAQTAFS